MNGLKLLSLLLILSAITQPLHAATEFEDSVPLEVVKQFIGPAFSGEARLYSDILDDFPPFAVPAGFTVLASTDQGFAQRVVLKTDLTAEEASTAAYAAFTAEGWTEIQMPGMNRLQTGFITSQQPGIPQQLCHNRFGMMNIGVGQGDGTRYVNLMRSGMQPGGVVGVSCDQMNGQAQQMMRGGAMMAQYVPRLVLPENTATGSPLGFFGGGGGGGSNNDWETRSTLGSEWSIDAVFEHFADQIDAQGWDRDADVTGSQMAMGSWTKTVEDDVELVGKLDVLVLADNTYDLRFRLVRKGQQGANAGQGFFTNGPAIQVREAP